MGQWVCTMEMHPGSRSPDHWDWEIYLNKFCFSVTTFSWLWSAGRWVEQGQHGLGTYLTRCWGVVEAPTWRWEELLHLSVWTQERSQTPLNLSFFCPKNPLNHFCNIQTSKTELSIGLLHRRVFFVLNVWQQSTDSGTIKESMVKIYINTR